MRKFKIGIISIYPPKNHLHTDFGGVAGYTKNLVTNEKSNQIIDNSVILANIINGKTEYYSDNNINVIRCWDKGKKSIFQIAYTIIKEHKNFDLVHLQHEFFLYGGLISAVLFPLLLLLLMVLGIKRVVTIHGVIPLKDVDISFLSENRLQFNSSISFLGLGLIIRSISHISNGIIVHETFLKDILTSQYYCNKEKIYVIPHGVEIYEKCNSKTEIKNELGLKDKKILLFFGYITGYKGIEYLIESFNILPDKENYYLIIAGGIHPRLKQDSSYLKYVNDLQQKAKLISNSIIFTGFVSDKEIEKYYCIADVVILPYTTGMASSGALSLAISYHTPFLISEALGKYNFPKEVVFRLNSDELRGKIESFFIDKNIIEKAENYIKDARLKMSWSEVSNMTTDLYVKILLNHER